jgi:alpha-beta hydrolase superfamily lysophospholipase
VVLPGRGERSGRYERLGWRLAADAYRVRVVGDTSADVDLVSVAVKARVEKGGRPAPVVLVGSDTGALLALRLDALGSVTVNGLVLAGLPDPALPRPAGAPGHDRIGRGVLGGRLPARRSGG